MENPMTLKEIVDLITNTSTTIFILGYFIFRDYKFMNTINTSLKQLNDTTNLLKELIMKGDH